MAASNVILRCDYTDIVALVTFFYSGSIRVPSRRSCGAATLFAYAEI
jgi:hypothetical protein